MSCVTFLTPAQRAALHDAGDEQLSPAEIAAQHPSPPVTDSKLRRLRLLARQTDPKIRQSAALNHHCPAELLAELADDDDVSVRCCVARQANSPDGLLQRLARDLVPEVRGWVAANPSVSDALLAELAGDTDTTVRGVVRWARNWRSHDAAHD